MTPSPLPIPRRELAPGYSIARVINGGWQLSHGHHPNDPEPEAAVQMLRRLAEAGLTTFDGADIYGGVEELFGRLRRTSDRPLEIHTKLVPDRSTLTTLKRRQIEQIVDRSLQRLGAERLDLVQLHWWDWEIPGYLEVGHWLRELQTAGKIAYLGVTNFDYPRLRELVESGVPVVSNQVQYSLLDRRPEHRLAPYCESRGIALLAYGTLAGGFLSERFLRKRAPGSDANRSQTKYRLIIDELGGWDALQDLLSVLHQIAVRQGVGLSSVAVRWVLDRPSVAAAIVGTRTAAHLEGHRQTFQLSLSPEDSAAIEGVLSRYPGASGPVFGLERQPGGAHSVIMKTELNQIDR